MSSTSKILSVFLAVTLATVFTRSAFALRCGNDLIQEGEKKTMVLRKIAKCGKVIGKEAYQKTSTRPKGSSAKTSRARGSAKAVLVETVYAQLAPYPYYCYEFQFVGGVLRKITGIDCR